MSEWQYITISKTNGYYDYATLTRIANLIGGTVNYASDLGYTSISGLWNNNPLAMNKLAVYIPDGSIYGLIFYAGASYGSAALRVYFVLLSESGAVTAKVGAVGCPYGGSYPARIFVGDGFYILADNLSASNDYRGWCAFDTFENVKENTDVFCYFSDYYAVDLETPIDESMYHFYYAGKVLDGSVVTQGDGTLYAELVPMPYVYDAKDYNGKENILITKNIKLGLFDYRSVERVIEVNGVEFSSILNSHIFFPTE